MSAKSTGANIKRLNFQGESESENWNLMPIDIPILAGGSGSYSEAKFGFFVPSRGIIKRVAFNAYPVTEDSTFNIKIKVIGTGDQEYEFPDSITFTGNMEAKYVNLTLPYDLNQVVFYHQSTENYPSSLVRIRLFFEVDLIE